MRRTTSFGGLALQLSADGYAQLPGEDWGYDDRTIARFEHDTKTRRCPATATQRFAARAKYLARTGPRRPGSTGGPAWWPISIAACRTRSAAGTRARSSTWPAPRCSTIARRSIGCAPPCPAAPSSTTPCSSWAFAPQSYHDDAGHRAAAAATHQAAGRRSRPPKPPIGKSTWRPAKWIGCFGGGRKPGSLFYHEPQKVRLASFDAKSPFGPANTYTWLVSQMSPSGDRNRRRFVHSLATLDAQEMFDGGWLLPLGQEDGAARYSERVSPVAARALRDVAGEHQPVTIRTLVRDGQTYVYLVNDSPWEITLTLGVELPRDCKLEKLGESRGVGALGPRRGRVRNGK